MKPSEASLASREAWPTVPVGSRITTKEEEREITAGFAGGGLVLLLAAAGTSLRRYGRLP